MAEQGPLPDLSGKGTQGLFDQSTPATQSTTAAPAPTTPGIPGAAVGATPTVAGERAASAKPPRKRKRRRLHRALLLVHLSAAAVGLVAIARSNHDSVTHFPKITVPKPADFSDLVGKGSSDTPAAKTMLIVPSGGLLANGVYLAKPAAIKGASTATALEFAITGHGSKQHVVYIAGLHIRDASCDHKPTNSSRYGLLLYNDELDTARSSVRGTAVRAIFKNGKERLTAKRVAGRTLSGTFRFGAYSSCPTGGHFTFKATRSRSNTPKLANALLKAAG
jgi:hypothetical protein